jgi:hypothetical protein
MQARQLLIVAGIAIVAFAAAFGIASAGGGDEPKAASDGVRPAEVIEVEDVAVTAGVATARGLPALNVPKKKPKETDTGTTTTAPSSTDTVTPPASETVTPPPTSTAAPPSSSTPPPVSGGDDTISSGGTE